MCCNTYFVLHINQQIFELGNKQVCVLPTIDTSLRTFEISKFLSQIIFFIDQAYICYSSYNIIEDLNKNMQRALFSNISNKTNRMRLKIQNEKSRILKNDEQIRLPIRTFTLAPRQGHESLQTKEGSIQKAKRQSKEHVRFKIDRSKTLNEPETDDTKQLQIRTKKLKQPKRKIISSFSTSKFIRLTKMDSQAPQFPEQNLAQGTQYNLLNQIIEVLKNNYLLFESGIMNYSMKKDDFLSLLLLIVYSQNMSQNSKCKNFVKLKYTKFSPLQQKLRKLQYNLKEQLRQSLDILTIQPNVFKFEYNSDFYTEDQQQTSKKLLSITEEIQQLNRQLENLRQDKTQILKLMKNIKSQLSQHLKEKVDLQTNVYELKDLNRELQIEISKKKKLVSAINQQAENIFNYLNNDNCKIIEKISIQYKLIQKEMHEYALYLQSNHMASEIGYEPRPFAQIQEVIVDEMKRINKTIIQDIEILPQLKQKLMRNFILRAMDKFKCKDSQMMKLNEFKTKCIRTYIQNIKKWLQNWTLKQQYLVNMRKQFIYDSEKLTDKIKKLRFIQSEGSTPQIGGLVEEVCGISEKIIENYKLGNSFY